MLSNNISHCQFPGLKLTTGKYGRSIWPVNMDGQILTHLKDLILQIIVHVESHVIIFLNDISYWTLSIEEVKPVFFILTANLGQFNVPPVYTRILQ